MRIPIRGAAAAALLLGWWATPAEAHDGEAIIEVDAAHEVPPNSVHYIVTVTWADDGHPAVDADVEATAVSPDGNEQVQGTLGLTDEREGTYEGQLDLRPIPGDWEVTFAALNPDGTETATYTLPEQEQAPEQPAEGSEQPDQEGEDAGSGDEAAAGEESAAEPETQSPEGDPDDVSVTEPEEDDDSPPLVLLAAVFVVLGAVVAGVFWLVVNRKTEGEAGGGDGGRGDGGGSDGTSDEGPGGGGATAAEPETEASADDPEADDSGADADSEPAAH